VDLSLSQEIYDEYLKKKETISNTRLRHDEEDFFDALLSDDGDMTKSKEGRNIISALQSLDE